MNLSLLNLEMLVAGLGVVLLLVDLWAAPALRRWLGYAAALGVVGVLALSFQTSDAPAHAFGQMFVSDALALFFKRFFLVAAALVLVIAAEHSEPLAAGPTEYSALVLFALTGMMLAASANHLAVLFVALELITVTFYVLTSFQRRRLASVEAGVKYLILGGFSSAIMVYGIALVYGTSGTMDFGVLATKSPALIGQPLFLVGLVLLLAGLGFKIAAVPFQMWAPDVYQGSPTATTAFLAVGSKAAGFVLLLRVVQVAVPEIVHHAERILVFVAGASILYGNLGAIPQRSLKRLLGYSSISNSGYLLMGLAAMSTAGSSAILYFLGGYLFTVIGALAAISVILRLTDSDDLSNLAGLSQRAPFLAASLTLAMVSLAGVPPLAGFFG